MKDIIKQAIKHDFTDLMIVNEDKKTPSKCFWEKVETSMLIYVYFCQMPSP